MDTTPAPQTTTDRPSQRRAELIPLRGIIFPVIVIIIMIVFFQLLAPELLGTTSLIEESFANTEPLWLLKEQRMRLLWGGSVIVWFTTCIAAIVYSYMAARTLLSPRGFWTYFRIGVVISAILATNLLVVSWLNMPLSILYSYPYDALSASSFYVEGRFGFIRSIVIIINGVLCITPVAVLLGGCSTTIDPDAEGEVLKIRLEQQMHYLRGFLNIGSMLLVTSILNLSLWLHWPSVLIANPEMSQAAAGFASAVSLFWGAAASMLIASFYLPAYIRLINIAHLRANSDPYLAKMDHEHWIKGNRTAQSPVQHFPQFAALIAPLLAAPLTNAVTGVSFI